jgi:2-dehydro-3-deoxygalactonokinase
MEQRVETAWKLCSTKKMQSNPIPSGKCAIALDGGTTNTRARLLHGWQIVATARRSVGVRDNVLPEVSTSSQSACDWSAAPASGAAKRTQLTQAIREVLDEVLQPTSVSPNFETTSHSLRPEYIIGAGMLSSEMGLAAVPHVEAPAGPDDLARALSRHWLPEISELPIYLIPGIRTPASDGPDGWFTADVMRGEECETWGAYATLRQSGVIQPGAWQAFLWPGSHTKVVEVDGTGRITRSHTSLAGELLQVVAKHTLLAASLPSGLPDTVDSDAAEAGRRAVGRDGLARAAFLIRVAGLVDALNAFERASFWIGSVVQSDVDSLARHSIFVPGRTVWIGGREPLRSLYAACLGQRHRGTVVPLDGAVAESASAAGAADIVSRRLALEDS